MKILSLIIGCAFYLSAGAQDYEIPDYRSKRESFLKTPDKVLRADLASFTIGGIDESFAKLPLISLPVKSADKNAIVLANDTLQVIIEAGLFDRSKYKVQFYETKYLVKVNGKAFYGTKNDVPSTVINNIVVVAGVDTIQIPATAYADLFEPNFYYEDSRTAQTKSHTGVYLSPDRRRIYIYMINGSGEGRYEVTWVVQDKTYLRRIVDYGF